MLIWQPHLHQKKKIFDETYLFLNIFDREQVKVCPFVAVEFVREDDRVGYSGELLPVDKGLFIFGSGIFSLIVYGETDSR